MRDKGTKWVLGGVSPRANRSAKKGVGGVFIGF